MNRCPVRDDYRSGGPDEEVQRLLRIGTNATCLNVSFPEALEWFITRLRETSPKNDRAARSTPLSFRRDSAVLLKEIWNHVPRPDNGFLPRRVKNPKPSDACYCMSGLKYSDCCRDDDKSRPFSVLIDERSILRFVLERVPKDELSSLVFPNISPWDVLVVLEGWLSNGRVEESKALIEAVRRCPSCGVRA